MKPSHFSEFILCELMSHCHCCWWCVPCFIVFICKCICPKPTTPCYDINLNKNTTPEWKWNERKKNNKQKKTNKNSDESVENVCCVVIMPITRRYICFTLRVFWMLLFYVKHCRSFISFASFAYALLSDWNC